MQFLADSDRATRWRAVIAVIAGSLVLLIPELVNQVLLGAAGEPGIDLLLLPLWVAFEATMLIVGVRWGTRRGLGPDGAALLAYGLAALFGAVSAVVYAEIAVASGSAYKHLGVVSEAVSGASNGILVAGVWSVFVLTPWAAEAARATAQRQSELQRATERARIAATLEPHFVLNTLNAISSLVVEDPQRARQLIGDLGDLLRDATRLGDSVTHSLDDELAWLRRYTRIIEARHGHRLEFAWEVDPETLRVHVPTLILQPLLENAIVHGAMQRPHGRVTLQTVRYPGGVRVTIRDDGPGTPGSTGTGRGLELVRRRLQVDAPLATLELAFGPDGGRAELTLPEVAP